MTLWTYPKSSVVAGVDKVNFSEENMKDIHRRLDDIDARLLSMEQSGIGYAILSLTSPGIEGILDADTAIDFARRSNDHIYQKYVEAYPDRFGFFCSVPLQKPQEAARELERCVTELGAKGVLVNGFTNMSTSDVNHVRYLDETESEPFWAMLAKLNVPITFIHVSLRSISNAYIEIARTLHNQLLPSHLRQLLIASELCAREF